MSFSCLILRARQGKGQPIREDGPEGHIIKKAGTPTMGGLLILLSVIVSVLLWGDLRNPFLWTVILVTVGYGLIGFYDDYLKVSRQNPKGFSGKIKLVLEFGIAAVAVYILTTAFPQTPDGFETGLAIPLLKNFTINLGIFFIPFGCFACMSLAVIAYMVGNAVFSDYLGVPYVPGSAEVTIFLGAIIGAGLGFLWYNAPPAMVFMGDTGSLALGGALGSTAVAIKHEIVLAVIGGLFVLEAVSVIVQVVSFKLTGKRVFRMAPIHHHFEKKGWAEPTIVIRFWIIAIILAAIFGLGRTGLSAAMSLQKGGARVLAWDDNETSRISAVAQGVATSDLNSADWSQIDALLLSPGIPHDQPKAHWSAVKAKAAGVRIICDIEIFAQEVASRAPDQRPKIIAITGTNGKSTTTSLIGHVLSEAGKDAQVGGNIGRGVLDLNPIHSGGYYVLELSWLAMRPPSAVFFIINLMRTLLLLALMTLMANGFVLSLWRKMDARSFLSRGRDLSGAGPVRLRASSIALWVAASKKLLT